MLSVEVSVQGRPAALLDEAKCALEHACGRLGRLQVADVMLFLPLSLGCEWVDVKEMRPLLLEAAARKHATSAGRVHDGRPHGGA